MTSVKNNVAIKTNKEGSKIKLPTTPDEKDQEKTPEGTRLKSNDNDNSDFLNNDDIIDNLSNQSMDDIEEEPEGVDMSESIAMLVKDHTERADQRKTELHNRRLVIQNRLQDLEDSKIRRELSKINDF